MNYSIYVEWEPTAQRAIHHTLYTSLKSCETIEHIPKPKYNTIAQLICSATSETCEEILEDCYKTLENLNLLSHIYTQLLYHKHINPIYNIDFLSKDDQFQKYWNKKILIIIDNL